MADRTYPVTQFSVLSTIPLATMRPRLRGMNTTSAIKRFAASGQGVLRALWEAWCSLPCARTPYYNWFFPSSWSGR